MEQGQAPSAPVAPAAPAAPAPVAPVAAEPPKRTLKDVAKGFFAAMDAEDPVPESFDDTPPPPPVEEEEPQEVDTAPAETAPEVEETTPEPDDAEEVDYEGKLYKVPKELKSALLRQADYTRKSQELAEGRNQVELMLAHAQQAVQAAQQFGDVLGQIKQADAAISQFHRLDWNALRESDPVEYATKQADYSRWQLHRQSLASSLNEAHQKVSQAQALEMRDRIAKAIPVLQEKIPGWGEAKQKEIRSHAQHYGYSDEELDGLIDPRAVLVLHDAMEYRKMQSRKVEAVKKVANLPPVAKPSARPQADEAKVAYQKTREAFRKDGGKDLNKVAALLSHRLRGK